MHYSHKILFGERLSMEALELYFNYIIIPLEKEIKTQRLIVKKKKYSLTRNIEKEYLIKLEELLNYYYEKFSIFVKDELH